MTPCEGNSQTESDKGSTVGLPKSLLKIGVESWLHKHLVLWTAGSHGEMAHLMGC